MPRLPIIQAEQGIRGQQLPVAGPEFFGAGIGRQLEQSAGVFQHIQDGYDAAESAKLIGEGSAGLRGVLVEAKTSISDPEEYKAFTESKMADVYGAVLERAPNERVRRAVEGRLANEKATSDIDAKIGYFEKKRDVARGDLDIAFDQMSKAAAAAPDEQSRISTYRTFSGLLGTMKASNYLTQEQVAEASMKFDRSVLTRQATAGLLTNPAGFLAEIAPRADGTQSDYYRLGEDKVLELGEKARRQIEHEEVKQDKLGKVITERVEQAWYSMLGTGQLSNAEIDRAIANENPWITPQKGLQFRRQKAEGTGGDKAPITAIMSGYYATDRNRDAIERTRRALSALQVEVGPNEFINKAFNELQTDASLLVSQGIALDANAIDRQNRSIANLQTDLEANRAVLPPGLSRLLGNTEQQEKAKVKDIYLKEGPKAAKDYVAKHREQTKEKAAAVPPATKRVIELP